MSIFKTQEAAQEAKDMEAYAATMHEDFSIYHAPRQLNYG